MRNLSLRRNILVMGRWKIKNNELHTDKDKSSLQIHRDNLGLAPVLLRPFLDESLCKHLTPAAGRGAEVHHPDGSWVDGQIPFITFQENVSSTI